MLLLIAFDAAPNKNVQPTELIVLRQVMSLTTELVEIIDMKSLITLLAVWLFVLVPTTEAQQQNKKQQDPFKHPFANPVDNPELPRVLIVGDSISIGYTPRVRLLLDGKANVHRPDTNCRWSAFGGQEIEGWIGDSKWDAVHFNFGLWDWYGWSQDVKATPESYAQNLNEIVTKLKQKTDAKLIFGLTTPPCSGPERNAKIVISEARAKEFNDAAIKVMNKHGIIVNDLYATIGNARGKYQRGTDDVHYKPEGQALLAAQVAKAIGKTLALKLDADKEFHTPQSDQQAMTEAREKATANVALPNVLLLGDSISIGYTPMVISQLKETANVTRPRSNCGDTNRYLKSLKRWLGKKQWDVIHFNVGLHDLCYRHPDSKVQGRRDKANGTIAVPLAEYEKNLEAIVTTLKGTGAKLIWASTTLVPEKEAGRIVGDDIKYNQVAQKVMKKHGVAINDLHALTSNFDSKLFTKPGNVHFKKEGSELLSKQVSQAIRDTLNAGATPEGGSKSPEQSK